MKQCPYCAEEIQDSASVCKHCKQNLMGWSIYDPIKKFISDTKKEIKAFMAKQLRVRESEEKERKITNKELSKYSSLKCPRCNKGYDKTWRICLDCRIPLVGDKTVASPGQ